jgi:hypothetical protein
MERAHRRPLLLALALLLLLLLLLLLALLSLLPRAPGGGGGGGGGSSTTLDSVGAEERVLAHVSGREDELRTMATAEGDARQRTARRAPPPPPQAAFGVWRSAHLDAWRGEGAAARAVDPLPRCAGVSAS